MSEPEKTREPLDQAPEVLDSGSEGLAPVSLSGDKAPEVHDPDRRAPGSAGPILASAALYAAKIAADLLLGSGPLITFPLPRRSSAGVRKQREGRRSFEERKSDLVKELLASGIDPLLFDSLLSNEIDRRLKTRFGVAFLLLTFLFTGISYAIVILNGIFQWRISDVAITGLIIETPLQFIGLLYIIARNLFPDGRRGAQDRVPRRQMKSRRKRDATIETPSNTGLQPTASSVRSSLASASGSG